MLALANVPSSFLLSANKHPGTMVFLTDRLLFARQVHGNGRHNDRIAECRQDVTVASPCGELCAPWIGRKADVVGKGGEFTVE